MGQASVVTLEGFHKTLCHAVALWAFHGRRYWLEADGFGKFPRFHLTASHQQTRTIIKRQTVNNGTERMLTFQGSFDPTKLPVV